MPDERIMRCVPKSKKEAIRDAYRDCDGFWIYLKEGWTATRSCAPRTIHEDDIKNLRYQIAGIRRTHDI